MQRQYDEYIRQEVIPFIRDALPVGSCRIGTMGASLGAYHAANTLFKHPDAVKRCFALSGVYDMRRFMDGVYDDNFYFNNPVDYLGGMNDPGRIGQLNTCDIHLATGTRAVGDSPATRTDFAHLLSMQGHPPSLDDWGPQGGHDWPYWKHQMREYLKYV